MPIKPYSAYHAKVINRGSATGASELAADRMDLRPSLRHVFAPRVEANRTTDGWEMAYTQQLVRAREKGRKLVVISLPAFSATIIPPFSLQNRAIGTRMQSGLC